jgi:hypothetical protein
MGCVGAQRRRISTWMMDLQRETEGGMERRGEEAGSASGRALAIDRCWSAFDAAQNNVIQAQLAGEQNAEISVELMVDEWGGCSGACFSGRREGLSGSCHPRGTAGAE